ncbi:MAG: hypothetical protein MZV64_04670 [Ignavibacteriales bacterium]|nr:hypothetical protein [Ignavibacteriales bacterium]
MLDRTADRGESRRLRAVRCRHPGVLGQRRQSVHLLPLLSDHRWRRPRVGGVAHRPWPCSPSRSCSSTACSSRPSTGSTPASSAAPRCCRSWPHCRRRRRTSG